MKQWNGLLKKEWISMKWHLLILLLTGILVISLVPVIVPKIFNMPADTFEVTLMVSFLWGLAAMFVPIGALITMLEREMKQPDVWLHSTASIFKLAGAKALFAVMLGTVAMLIPGIVLLIESIFMSSTLLTFKELFVIGGSFLLNIFMSSISIMFRVFFLWVLYRLIKPVIGVFSLPAVVLLFFTSSAVMGSIRKTEIYSRLSTMGKIDLFSFQKTTVPAGAGEFYIGPNEFYTGEVVIDFLVTIALVIGGAILFEKKVRL